MTAIAALRTGRYFVGYEIVPEYVQLAYLRIEKSLNKNKNRMESKVYYTFIDT